MQKRNILLIYRDIQLGTRVTRAVFRDETDDWEIHTDRGDLVIAQFFISAVGCLSAANVPPLPGLESFEGEWYHTGAWPKEPVDFSGKRVGLLGTGSTGIQVTPVVAAEAGHLTVFQRTPNYSVPARNFALTHEQMNEIKSNYREIRRKARGSGMKTLLDDGVQKVLKGVSTLEEVLSTCHAEALLVEG